MNKLTLYLLCIPYFSETSCLKMEMETSKNSSSEVLIYAASGVAGGVVIILIIVLITVKYRNRTQRQNENPDYLTAVSENVVYSRTNEIQYLSGEAEKPSQMNQYSSMSTSSDGSGNFPVDNTQKVQT